MRAVNYNLIFFRQYNKYNSKCIIVQRRSQIDSNILQFNKNNKIQLTLCLSNGDVEVNQWRMCEVFRKQRRFLRRNEELLKRVCVFALASDVELREKKGREGESMRNEITDTEESPTCAYPSHVNLPRNNTTAKDESQREQRRRVFRFYDFSRNTVLLCIHSSIANEWRYAISRTFAKYWLLASCMQWFCTWIILDYLDALYYMSVNYCEMWIFARLE